MSEATSGETTHRRLTPWILGVGAVTFLAGLLFGYDQGVISGALPLVTADLDLSEIYPNRVRGRAIAVVTASNWFAAFLVAQFFLDRRCDRRVDHVLPLLGLLRSTWLFVWPFVPETMGRTLEKIQEDWRHGRRRGTSRPPHRPTRGIAPSAASPVRV